MSHDLLYDFEICLVLAESGTEGMPEMMAREVRKNDRITVFFLCLYDLFRIVVMGDSFDRPVNGLRVRHATVPIHKNETAHSINDGLVETALFLFFSFASFRT